MINDVNDLTKVGHAVIADFIDDSKASIDISNIKFEVKDYAFATAWRAVTDMSYQALKGLPAEQATMAGLFYTMLSWLTTRVEELSANKPIIN